MLKKKEREKEKKSNFDDKGDKVELAFERTSKKREGERKGASNQKK